MAQVTRYYCTFIVRSKQYSTPTPSLHCCAGTFAACASSSAGQNGQSLRRRAMLSSYTAGTIHGRPYTGSGTCFLSENGEGDGENGAVKDRETSVSFGSMTKTVLLPLSPATTSFNPFGIPAKPPVCRRNKCRPGRSNDAFVGFGRFTVSRTQTMQPIRTGGCN